MMQISDKVLFQSILNPENLYHAWKKTKNIYDNESDFVFNRQALSEYEADLQENLERLAKRLRENQFQMTPMLPMPLPKTNSEKKVSRQHFHICLEDQIVWLAVINILGPLLDDQMSYWSFGNRLYMPIWKEDVNGSDKQITMFGTYRPSSRKIYRNWTSSWPLFRKAVAITAKKMLHCNDMNEDDLNEIDTYDNAPDSFKKKTWKSDYWNKKSPEDKDVFYATIDLEKFYPSIDAKKSILSDTILKIIGVDPQKREQSDLYALLAKLLSFTINNQYASVIDDSTEIEGDREGDKFFGIPTGLFVAGFLANIAMLEIDQKVQALINASRRIAHFRFVDDHVFLAYSVEELRQWILDYEEIVSRCLLRVNINKEKMEPEAFKKYYEEYIKGAKDGIEESVIKEATEQCRLDPLIASPFSTLTIKKLSGLNKDPFELMDESEKADLLRDVEHILVTDFPETEIRKDTRVSWAAMLLSRLVPEIDFDTSKLVDIGSRATSTLDQSELTKLDELEKAIDLKRDNLNKKVFSLLLKALKDNIGKPKIWKKCVNFCRTTGYDGLDLLLKQLVGDTKLSDNGKSYIFATIINEVSLCMLTCITVNKSNRYSLYEKKNAERFEKSISAFNQRLLPLSTKYALYYTEAVLEQFRMALFLYFSETKSNLEFKPKDTYVYVCYMWYAMERTANVFQTAPPISLAPILKSAMPIESDKAIVRKLRQMYALNTASFQKTRNKTLTTWVVKKNDILPNWTKQATKEIDLLASEWTCLEIILKVIETISKKKAMDNIFSFDDQNHNDFIFSNCSPNNFELHIASRKPQKNPWGWSEYKSYFRKYFKLDYNETFADDRYDYIFYNTYGNISLPKRQVCSLATLLITLLSDSLVFPPLFNRRDPIDRSYTHILGKTKELNVSSYTRAIILGALSYREFEKSCFSIFDGVISARDDDTTQDPIKIEDIDDMKKHTLAAQKRLERYQLSLENQTPRQLIPISLVNLSRTYNPYFGGDE